MCCHVALLRVCSPADFIDIAATLLSDAEDLIAQNMAAIQAAESAGQRSGGDGGGGGAGYGGGIGTGAGIGAGMYGGVGAGAVGAVNVQQDVWAAFQAPPLPVPDTMAWIQCSHCDKWRQIPM